MTEQEYKAMKAQHEAAAQSASEARGAKKGLEERLLKEFKLVNLAAAKAKLKQMDAEVARLDKEVDAAATAYHKEFPGEG
jgi:hypothetical protein